MSASDYRLARHPRFGFWQIQPTPEREAIDRFYAEEFYSSAYTGFNDSSLETRTLDQDFYDAHTADLCQSVVEISGRPLVGQSVLDVGCGWCHGLRYMKAQGAHCHGFDPAPEAVTHGREQGLEVVCAGMETMAAFPKQRFDVVTLLNVLEHLADPVGALTEIRECVIRPGGVLVIDVPNEFNPFQLAARDTHALKDWWVAPPAHLNYFDPDTLGRLLQGTGFEVRLMEASFPMEMFLLFGENYVGDGALGRRCHERRMAFEANLRRHGQGEMLRRFYRSLAELGLGRQVVAYAVAA